MHSSMAAIHFRSRRRSSDFSLMLTDILTCGRTDRQMDGRTDRPSYRDMRTHLRKYQEKLTDDEQSDVEDVAAFVASCILKRDSVDGHGIRGRVGVLLEDELLPIDVLVERMTTVGQQLVACGG